jgi:hypothetical protein
MGRSLVAMLLLVPLAAAACGENSKQQRQKFLAEANGICGHFGTLQNQVRFPSANPLGVRTSHADRARWGLALNQIVNYGRQEVRRLRKLKPEDLRERFEKMVGTKEAAFDDLATGADAAKRNHRSAIKAPVDAGRAKLARASSLAKALGLPKCA